ncbi:MAG: hypothetical protein FWC69_03055, partial [Defluviitaleaceae bacterium]|nr:hypothetical protein [Defluviitaleaceae bacterium]
MKRLLRAGMLAIGLLMFAGCAVVDECGDPPSCDGGYGAGYGYHDCDKEPPCQGAYYPDRHNIAIDRYQESDEEAIRIGITNAVHDDVGQILMFFGGGVDFSVVSSRDMSSLQRLSEFYAIFINCGSHSDIDEDILRAYVEQGGIVYASDLASTPLARAFPGVFRYTSVSSSMTVRGADVTHTSLASHMGVSSLDVVFNMGGWNVITQLSEEATVYIEGYIPNHGTSPLAISFEYGDGMVFFTSFHNNAQATSSMVIFVEYLIFRMKHIEADRHLAERAERAGFVHSGNVFGFFGAARNVGNVMAAAEGAGANFSMDMMEDSAELESFFAMAPTTSAPSLASQQTFSYNFGEGVDFMLMVEASGQPFTIRLY